MIVLLDRRNATPEVTVCGSALELVDLGTRLVAGLGDLTVPSDSRETKPGIAKGHLRCEVDLEFPDSATISVLLEGDVLRIVGGKEGLAKLGQSCINVFSRPKPGVHFHLDYVEGDPFIKEAACSLIFAYDAEVRG